MHKFCGNELAFADLQHTAGTFEPHESDTMTMLAWESMPLWKMVQSGGSAIARNQCGTGKEQRRRLHLRMTIHIVHKGDGE